MVTLVFSRSPRASSKNLLCSQLVPRLFWCRRLLLPRGRTFCSPVLNFMRALLVHFSSLSLCLSVAAQPVCTHHLHTLSEGALCPTTQVIYEDVKHCGSSSALSHANTTSDWPPDALCVTGHSSEPGRAVHFQPTSLSLSLARISWVICVDIMGDCQKLS